MVYFISYNSIQLFKFINANPLVMNDYILEREIVYKLQLITREGVISTIYKTIPFRRAYDAFLKGIVFVSTYPTILLSQKSLDKKI